MGYIIAIVIVLLVVPLLFILLSRRTHSTGGLAARQRNRGVTVSAPSSDQPSPGGRSSGGPTPGSDERIPPG